MTPHGYRPQFLAFNSLGLLALVGLSFWVMQSVFLQHNPQLVGTAVVVDLTLSASLFHAWFGVKKGGLPRWSIVTVGAGGLALSHWLVPELSGRAGLIPLFAVAAVEISVLVLVGFRITRLVRTYRSARSSGARVLDAIEHSLVAIMPAAPKLASWVRLELELWVLCLSGWFRRTADNPDTSFSHYRETSWLPIASLLAFLTVVEGSLLHYWLSTTGQSIAQWIAWGLHAYSLVWLLGDAQAFRLYRSVVHPLRPDQEAHLEVRFGLRGSLSIPLSKLTHIDVGEWEKATSSQALLRLMGAANLRLKFSCPQTFQSPFRAPRPVDALLLQVDDPQALRRALLRHSPYASVRAVQNYG